MTKALRLFGLIGDFDGIDVKLQLNPPVSVTTCCGHTQAVTVKEAPLPLYLENTIYMSLFPILRCPFGFKFYCSLKVMNNSFTLYHKPIMGGQEIEGEKKCTALTTRVTQLCNLVDSQYIYFIYIYI